MSKDHWIEMGKEIAVLHEFARKIFSQQGSLTLTTNELDILSAIFLAADQVTANQIGQKLQLQKASVSRTLKKLIDLGLAEKTSNPRDERSHCLSLTPCGLKSLNENYQILLAPYYYAQRSDPAAFASLIAQIGRLNQLLDEYNQKEGEQ
ncbi:MAG: MarR family transcriptional regulator [Enterococcaceae bacterium]|nr:MarR family transcriptional regulator [Enterococcaceae bacterium]